MFRNSFSILVLSSSPSLGDRLGNASLFTDFRVALRDLSYL